LLPNEALSAQPLDELKKLSSAPQKRQRHRKLPNTLSSPSCKSIVRNTFIHMSPMPSGASKRSRSVPKDIGSQFVEIDEDLTTFLEDRSTDIGSGSLTPSFTCSPLWTPREQIENDMSCSLFWYAEDVYTDPLATAQFCASDLAIDMDTSACLPAPWTFDTGMCHFSFPTEAWTSDAQTCVPTWSADVEPAKFPEPEPDVVSKKACDGSILRNTFIEVASPPSSPGASHCRSQSVPRNLGSDRTPTSGRKTHSLPSLWI